MSQPLSALSVDFEFFSHLPAYRSASGNIKKQSIGLDGVMNILDAFEAVDAAGTFFIVGEIANGHSDVIKHIFDKGHEVASHTHTHQHLSEISPPDRYEELVTSKDRLEAVTGNEVIGFRAPSFDIADNHFENLATIGYTYDSSITPCRSIPGWYGGEYKMQRPAFASKFNTEESDMSPPIAEIPLGVMPGLRLPLTGTWLRFFGVTYTILGMRLLARRGIPPVLYIHPWELVDLPPVRGVPSRVYVRTGAYMRRAIRKILAQPFNFVTVGKIAETVKSGSDDDSMNSGHNYE